MIKYCFDGYIQNRACGWVADLATPGKKLHIALVISGEVVTVCEASDYRKDLEAIGYADGKFGFSIPLPDIMEGDCYLRIVELQKDLQESRFESKVIDAPSALLFRTKDFSRYLQLSSVREHKGHYSGNARSTRMANVLGKCNLVSSGLSVPDHATWAIERNRRGGARFFSIPTESAWSDFAWYIFDYNGHDKSLYNLDPNNPLIQSLATPPFVGLSPLYIAWLLRTGKQVSDISKATEQQKYEFLSALLSARNSVSGLPELEVLKRPVAKKIKTGKLRGLPKLSRYLQWKYETGYTHSHNIETDAGLLAYIFDIAIHASAFELEYFGSEVNRFFEDDVIFSDGATTRFEFLTWLYYKRIDSPSFSINEDIKSSDIRRFFRREWLAVHPEHLKYMSVGESGLEKHAPEIYVVAHWDSGSGLTQNAIMSVKAFAKAGIAVTKIYPNGEVFCDLNSYEVETFEPASTIAKDVVVLHVNADEAPEAMAMLSQRINVDAAHVIGFYLWELEEVPKAHHLGLELVDEIWAPTQFVYDAYRAIFPDKTRLVRKALQVPDFVGFDRQQFGIPDSSFAMLLSFDYHSCIERKNPVIAVDAFQKAFSLDDDVTLVVKTTDFAPDHWGDPFRQWQAVRTMAESDPRIVIIEDYLGNDDFFTLINSCDAVISTHRAEGFGYLPAYGLWLGKSVIVTNYSGTADFCTSENSYLVDYSLVPVPNSKFVYPMIKPVWADVKIDSLVDKYRESKRSAHIDRRSHAAKIKQDYSFSKLAGTYIAMLRESGVLL